VIFFGVSLILFLRDRSSLFAFLIFSSIFQAASVLSYASFQPYYLVAIFFIFRCVLDNVAGHEKFRLIKGFFPFMAFFSFALISAFLFPFLFEGTPVYDPSLGLDIGASGRTGLQFSGGNKYQASLLTINWIVFFLASTMRLDIMKASKAFRYSFYFLFIVLLIQQAFLYLEIEFPYYAFNNDNNYAIKNADLSLGLFRPNGTFIEPSMAGAPILAFLLGYLSRYLKEGQGLILFGMAVTSLLIVSSGASFLALAIGSIIVFLKYKPFNLNSRVSNNYLKKYLFILFLFIILLSLMILIFPSLAEIISDQLFNKKSSLSFESRSTAELYVLDLLYQTNGFGVGIGSNRLSGLLTTIAGATGVVGITLFLNSLFRLLMNSVGEYYWLKWILIGLILDMSIGVPDISFPPLWAIISLLACATKIDSIESTDG